MYRAASGALVFSAGTIQWTWGLDSVHDTGFDPQPPADPRMQQAQVNLLADMGAQPTTLMAGLTPAAPSTDATGPTVTIDSPAPASTQPNGSRVTVSGSATDQGGQVAGVEVSTDRGATWHPAAGRTQWSYTYTQHGYGATPVRVRAVDDSANIGHARSRFFSVPCPCSVFGSEVPDLADAGHTIRPPSSVCASGPPGTARSPGSASTSPPPTPARTWGRCGPPRESGSPRPPSPPRPRPAGSRSRSHNRSRSARRRATSSPTRRRPATTPPTWTPSSWSASTPVRSRWPAGTPPTPPGCGPAAGSFPSQQFRNTNYYVDVEYTPSGPPDPFPGIDIAAREPAPGAAGVARNTTVRVAFTAPIEPGATLAVTVGGTPVAGALARSGEATALTFTPAAPLPAHTGIGVALSDVTSVDGAELAPSSWSFTTGAAGGPPGGPPGGTPGERQVTLFGGAKPRSGPSDGRGIEVGVEFTSRSAGRVTALRYYRQKGRPSPRSIALWTAKGKKIVRVKLPKKQATTAAKRSAWHAVALRKPVRVPAGKRVVVSYYLPHGKAPRTRDFYPRKTWKSGPLRVKRADNGLYRRAGRSRFPTKVKKGANFFVDVVFRYPPS